MNPRDDASNPRELTAIEQAELYRLGLLTQEEASEFERHAATDPCLAEAVRDALETSLALASAAPQAEPPPRLRDRLMARLREVERPSLGAVRSTEGRWKPTGHTGVSYKKLYFDKDSGLVTMLVRMQPGTRYPAHIHNRTEQCLVLEGDLRHHDRVYGAGDFTWAEAGSVDPELHTETGNLLLIIAAPQSEVARF